MKKKNETKKIEIINKAPLDYHPLRQVPQLMFENHTCLDIHTHHNILHNTQTKPHVGAALHHNKKKWPEVYMHSHGLYGFLPFFQYIHVLACSCCNKQIPPIICKTVWIS